LDPPVIARVPPDSAPGGRAKPQTKTIDLCCESACRLLHSTLTITVY